MELHGVQESGHRHPAVEAPTAPVEVLEAVRDARIPRAAAPPALQLYWGMLAAQQLQALKPTIMNCFGQAMRLRVVRISSALLKQASPSSSKVSLRAGAALMRQLYMIRMAALILALPNQKWHMPVAFSFHGWKDLTTTASLDPVVVTLAIIISTAASVVFTLHQEVTRQEWAKWLLTACMESGKTLIRRGYLCWMHAVPTLDQHLNHPPLCIIIMSKTAPLSLLLVTARVPQEGL